MEESSGSIFNFLTFIAKLNTNLNGLDEFVSQLQGRHGGTRHEGVCPPLESSNDPPVTSVLLNRKPDQILASLDCKQLQSWMNKFLKY